MIRLDSNENEKERILELLTATIDNPKFELECLFNNSSNRNNPNITYNNFMTILKRYNNNPEFETKTFSRLAISFPESTKLNSVRVLVKGTGAISTYCNSDSLNGLLNMVDFEIKSRPKMRFTSVMIPNYDIKFNLKMETNFNNDEARIKEIMQEWNELNKNFRYKKIGRAHV